jgi:hypothetical protein
MKRIKTLIFVIAVLISAATYAQKAKVLTDTGLMKLKVFVGTWKSQSNDNEAAKNSNGAVTTCRWSVNGNYLVCDQMITNGDKKSNNLALYSYDHAKDQYSIALVGIPGADPYSIPISYKGDVLIYSGEYKNKKGEKVYDRTLNTFFTSKYYTYTVQSSKDGTNWTTLKEGKAFKIKE